MLPPEQPLPASGPAVESMPSALPVAASESISMVQRTQSCREIGKEKVGRILACSPWRHI